MSAEALGERLLGEVEEESLDKVEDDELCLYISIRSQYSDHDNSYYVPYEF